MYRICFFSGDISRKGGTERVCTLIANELSATYGYQVSIISFQNGDNSHFPLNPRIMLYSLHMEQHKGFVRRKVCPYLRLIKFLTKHPQDVLIHVDVLLCLYSLPIKRLLKPKLIAWEHFNFRTNNGVKNRYRARRLAIEKSDRIIVLTKADQEEYYKQKGMRTTISYIYNPTVKRVPYQKKEMVFKRVLAVGRLTYPKNYQELIDIWKQMGALTKGWELVIVGDGEDIEDLQERILKYSLDNVRLPGYCTNVDEYYTSSDIMVMTSRYEGFPMVLLEAQIAGLPIVAYDCFTGPSEIIIDGKNGFLIPLGNREAFVNALRTLITNPQKLYSMGEWAHFDAARFDLANIGKLWDSMLKEVLQND